MAVKSAAWVPLTSSLLQAASMAPMASTIIITFILPILLSLVLPGPSTAPLSSFS